MTKRTQKEIKAAAKRYEPTPREYETITANAERLRRKAPTPSLKITKKDDEVVVGVDHPDLSTGSLLLMAALGTGYHDFSRGFVQQLANVGTQGREVDEAGVNFMLAMVKGVEPKDQLEAMLAAQMAAVHNATMTFARRLAHVENIPQQDAAEKAFNKLARTFTTQMAALKQYRTGGQQKMTVEHVHVHEGGQAIVGNVQGGGAETKKPKPTS